MSTETTAFLGLGILALLVAVVGRKKSHRRPLYHRTSYELLPLSDGPAPDYAAPV